MITKNDVANHKSWCESHIRDIDKRLADSDDKKDVRRILRISKNLANQMIPICEDLKFKFPNESGLD